MFAAIKHIYVFPLSGKDCITDPIVLNLEENQTELRSTQYVRNGHIVIVDDQM